MVNFKLYLSNQNEVKLLRWIILSHSVQQVTSKNLTILCAKKSYAESKDIYEALANTRLAELELTHTEN